MRGIFMKSHPQSLSTWEGARQRLERAGALVPDDALALVVALEDGRYLPFVLLRETQHVALALAERRIFVTC